MVCSYIKADPTVNGLRKLVVALANNDTLSALTSPQRAVILGRSIGVLCPDRAGLLTVYKAQTKRDAKLLVAARNAGLTDSDEILLSSAQAVCEIEQGSGDPVADMAVAVMSGGFTQQDKLADFVGVIVDHNFCQW